LKWISINCSESLKVVVCSSLPAFDQRREKRKGGREKKEKKGGGAFYSRLRVERGEGRVGSGESVLRDLARTGREKKKGKGGEEKRELIGLIEQRIAG